MTTEPTNVNSSIAQPPATDEQLVKTFQEILKTEISQLKIDMYAEMAKLTEQMATKEDVAKLTEQMATKEDVAKLKNLIDDNYDLIKSHQRADNYGRFDSNQRQTVSGTGINAGRRDSISRSSFH